MADYRICFCVREDHWDCAKARFGMCADEPCECECHYPDEPFTGDDYFEYLDAQYDGGSP